MNTCIDLCHHRPSQHAESFPHSTTHLWFFLCSHIFHLTGPLATTVVSSVPYWLVILQMSCKWNHTACNLSDSFFLQCSIQVGCVSASFLSVAEQFSRCGRTTLLSPCRTSGCLQHFAVMNEATLNTSGGYHVDCGCPL